MMKKLYSRLLKTGKISFAALALSLNVQAQAPVISGNPIVELIQGGFQFTEGPLWIDSLGLLFSDVRANTVYRYNPTLDTVTVYYQPSGNSNGLQLDSTGSLLLAQHGKRRVARLVQGVESNVASSFDGKLLNSPNDLVIKSGGSVFFTDPPYGITPDQQQLSFSGVYRVSPKGVLTLLDSTLARPNGIVFSPDETKLYVNNAVERKIYSWDVVNDSTFTNKQEFAFLNSPDAGNADGMTVDSLGNVYSAGPGGIWVIAPDKTILATIPLPGQTTNCTFGGAYRDTLYVTASANVYKVYNGVLVGLNEVTVVTSPLLTNYPNPASTNTIVPVSLPASGFIQLQILDLQGNKIADLAEGTLNAGNYSFNWNCETSSKGLYLIKLLYDNRSYVKTCIVK